VQFSHDLQRGLRLPQLLAQPRVFPQETVMLTPNTTVGIGYRSATADGSGAASPPAVGRDGLGISG
jgi:hypothetical protein